jgi:hypothetical protein
MSYTGEWTSQAAPVKAKASGTAGSSVAFTFNGSGIYWRVATGPDCGKADVYLDEVFQKTVDLYGGVNPYMFGFVKTGLDIGAAHTVKIAVKGEKNSKSSGTAVRHMSFEYSAESWQASDGFSSAMGKNQWHYQSWDGAGLVNLEFNLGGNVWAKGPVAVGPDYQTPDGPGEAVRKWVAPHAGTVRIEGVVSLNAAGGDGVKAKVMHNTAEVWGPSLVTHGNPASHDFTVDAAQGDAISFRVNKNVTNVNDRTAWDPVITYVGKKGP